MMARTLKGFAILTCAAMLQAPLLCDGPGNAPLVEWIDGGADGKWIYVADPNDPSIDWTDQAGDG